MTKEDLEIEVANLKKRVAELERVILGNAKVCQYALAKIDSKALAAAKKSAREEMGVD